MYNHTNGFALCTYKDMMNDHDVRHTLRFSAVMVCHFPVKAGRSICQKVEGL